MKSTRNIWILAALPAVCLSAQAGAQNITVTVNGSPVQFDNTQPRMINGRVLVPLRGVLEKLGAHVGWIPQNQTVTADRGSMDIVLPIGSHTAQVNGKSVTLDVPAMVVAGSTLVPLRFVSEALGADVGWSSATETVAIRTSGDDGGAPDVHFRAHRDLGRDDRGGDHRDDAGAPHRRSARIIPAGSLLDVRLDGNLSTVDSGDGEQFTLTILNRSQWAGLPEGTKIAGIVRHREGGHDGNPPVLDLELQSMVFPDGDTRPIDARIVHLDDSLHREGERNVHVSVGTHLKVRVNGDFTYGHRDDNR